MNSLAVPFALPWLAFATTWVILAPVVVLLHRLVRRPLARVGPAQRAALLLALSLLPLIVALLVVVLGFAPAVGGFMVNGHCHPDTGCHPHVPSLQASIVEALWLSTLVALGSFAVLWGVGRRLRRSLGLAGALLELTPSAGSEGFAIVETDARFAYCVGLMRPRIVVSRGLLARLAGSELAAVLAHERAHAARFDNLRQWLAAVSLWPLPQTLRRGLLRDLAAANDESCDGRAAELIGSRCRRRRAGVVRLGAACSRHAPGSTDRYARRSVADRRAHADRRVVCAVHVARARRHAFRCGARAALARLTVSHRARSAPFDNAGRGHPDSRVVYRFARECDEEGIR